MRPAPTHAHVDVIAGPTSTCPPHTAPTQQTGQARPGGYTLAEMMVVVLIVATVAVVAVPAVMAPLSESRFSAALTEVVTALEFARMTAISSGRHTRVTIDAAADTIVVEWFAAGVDLLGSEIILPEASVEGGSFVPMPHPLNRSADYFVNLSTEARFAGVEIDSAAFGANDWVVFDALGIPSSGGTVQVSSEIHQGVVTLFPVTGIVEVSD